MSGGSREPDRPPRAEDGSGNTVVIENRLEKSREARRHAIDLHRRRERLLPCGHVQAHASACFEQPIVRNTAGFHFDKWQLDWPRIARVTTMSPIYRSHSRSALALASARMLEYSCRAIGIHAM